MKLNKLLGQKLKEIRECKGLTQQELAELCDMHTTSIGMIEIGRRTPSLATVELFAEKLGVDYVDLFDFSKEFNLDESEERLKIDLGREISDFDKKQLRHMINLAKSIKELCQKKKR